LAPRAEVPWDNNINSLRCQTVSNAAIEPQRLFGAVSNRVRDLVSVAMWAERTGLRAAIEPEVRFASFAAYDGKVLVDTIVERANKHVAFTNTGKLIGSDASRSATLRAIAMR
jgi:hypothetical protein